MTLAFNNALNTTLPSVVLITLLEAWSKVTSRVKLIRDARVSRPPVSTDVAGGWQIAWGLLLIAGDNALRECLFSIVQTAQYIASGDNAFAKKENAGV